jgi:hypothetical protein
MHFPLALLLLCFNADTVAAQAMPTPAQAAPARPPADVRAKPDAFAEAVADCDRGTRMSRKEWSQTCRRVQTRLQNLKIN